ncbi:MAG: EcsC family protein, partial [Roseiarcus sp.]
GYFAVRGALAKSVSESARFLAQRGVIDGSAPVLVRLISQVAARFGVVVGEKLAAQAVPVLGAIGGAAVNVAFAEHFQTLARGHFIVRRLERAHGADAVLSAYQRLRGQA